MCSACARVEPKAKPSLIPFTCTAPVLPPAHQVASKVEGVVDCTARTEAAVSCISLTRCCRAASQRQQRAGARVDGGRGARSATASRSRSCTRGGPGRALPHGAWRKSRALAAESPPCARASGEASNAIRGPAAGDVLPAQDRRLSHLAWVCGRGRHAGDAGVRPRGAGDGDRAACCRPHRHGRPATRRASHTSAFNHCKGCRRVSGL